MTRKRILILILAGVVLRAGWLAIHSGGTKPDHQLAQFILSDSRLANPLALASDGTDIFVAAANREAGLSSARRRKSVGVQRPAAQWPAFDAGYRSPGRGVVEWKDLVSREVAGNGSVASR